MYTHGVAHDVIRVINVNNNRNFMAICLQGVSTLY
jgi:hypothetical protein